MAKNKLPNNKQSIPANKECKKKNGSYSRNKGHTFERQLVAMFREEFGFDKCITSRNGSKILDDSKVDLCNIPLNIQAKCGYKIVRPKFEKVFLEMKEGLEKNFLESSDQIQYPRVLIHKIDGKADENIGVTMTLKDWKEMYKDYLEYQKIRENGK